MNLLQSLLKAANQTTATVATIAKKEREVTISNKIPTGLTIRLFTKTGAVYPSKELVEFFNLEYADKATVELQKTNFNASQLSGKMVAYSEAKPTDFNCGLDVIATKGWLNFSNQDISLLYVAAVPRVAGRTDLFSSCKFVTEEQVALAKVENPDSTLVVGQSTTTVQEQGGNEYTKSGEFLEVVCAAYELNIEAVKTQEYIDLVVFPDTILVQKDEAENPIEQHFTHWVVKKKVARGERAGQSTIVERFGIAPMVLAPANLEELLNLPIPSTTPAATPSEVVKQEVDETRANSDGMEGFVGELAATDANTLVF